MATILKQNSEMIQYQAALGNATFNVPFYVYDVSLLKVYKTLAGNTANDITDLLTYTTDYHGQNNVDGSGTNGTITLNIPTNAGDIITIFYSYGAVTLLPRYPFCSTAQPGIDDVLPPLQPGCTWIKSSNGNSIQSVALPATQTVSLPTVPNAMAVYTNDAGATASANTNVASTFKSGSRTYDNLAGINNITIHGNLKAGTGLSTYGEDADIFGTASADTITASTKISIQHTYSNAYSTNIVGALEVAGVPLSENITYNLPNAQAIVPDSLLSNDSNGVLSWLPQSEISAVGTITSGVWNAGAVTADGDITASGGTVSGSNAVFTTSLKDGSVTANSIAIADANNPPNVWSFNSPLKFSGNYNYKLAATAGTTGDVLMLFDDGNGSGRLLWTPPLYYGAATRAQVYAESPSDLYVDPTQMKYHKGIAKAWIRFHVAAGIHDPYVVITNAYNCTASYVAAGLYNIIFPSTTFWSFGGAYTMHGMGYMASTNNIAYIMQHHSSVQPYGQDPQPGNCIVGLYNKDGVLTDPFSIATAPNSPADVYIAFFGTLGANT